MVVRDGRLRWPVPGEIQELVDLVIHRVSRRAKYLLLETDFGTAILHLGMSGSLRVLDIGTPAEKHDHVDIELANGKLLRLNDPRRFGALLWTREPAEAHALLVKLGPEPLTDAFHADYLRERAKGRSTAIKQFLMDNHVVVGWQHLRQRGALCRRHSSQAGGGQHQRRAAGHPGERDQTGAGRSHSPGGTTLKDFTSADGKPGYFVQQLQVYGRGGQPCFHCHTLLTEVKMGQRTTVFCSHCQR